MSWRDLVLNNFGWKLVSLLLATLVWFTIRSGGEKRLESFELSQGFGVGTSTRDSRDFFHQPIRLMNRADDLRRFNLDPGEVDITVAGQRSLLRDLSAKEIQAFITPSESSTTAIFTSEVRVYAPSGVSVVRVAPAKVRVEAFPP